jgi:hypothetical protein
VVWASNKVTDAVPTPFEKLTDAGYAGAVPPGEFDGPVKVIACEPVYARTVFPAASSAVRVTGKAVPAVALAAAVTTKWVSGPELTVAGVEALVEVHDRQIAVTV